MTTAANAVDVLEIALGMERIGRDFYGVLALASDDAKVRDFCFRAARDEGNHLTAFQRLRQRFAASASAAPGQAPTGVTNAWITLTKKHIQPDARRASQIALGGDIHAAIDMAIQMEQDAIVFYESLLAQMPGSAAVLQAIIGEERHHVSSLYLLVP